MNRFPEFLSAPARRTGPEAAPPGGADGECARALDAFRLSVSAERRRARRYLVTLSAQVLVAGRAYRTEILDVSAGGMLLAPASGLAIGRDTQLEIEAAMIGRVRARAVGITRHGIHLRIDPPTSQYDSAIERLSILSQAW